MSLDVYLTMEGITSAPADVNPRIFVRHEGATKKISRKEWDQLYPGREPAIAKTTSDPGEVYFANITHNLNTMAKAAGIYLYLWRPDEIGIDQAKQLIEPLREGLARLTADPDRFKALNPTNGWGRYEGLVHFVERYLTACEQHPEATVSVWR